MNTKEIRARADAATPGPWGVWEDHAEIWAGILENTPGQIRSTKGGGPIGNFEQIDDGVDEDSVCMDQSVDNAVFAAAARDDVPRLCDRVEALEAALREATNTLDALVNANDDIDDMASAARAYVAANAIIARVRAVLESP